MEEHGQEPQWYDQARKGPFQQKKFNEADADSVIRQLEGDGPARNKETPAGRRRTAIRARILSAALVLLLLGAGALYLGGGIPGRAGSFNPAEAASAVMYNPPAAGTADLTDAGLKQTAGQLMEEQLGRQYPFVSLERLEEPEAGIAEVLFQEGDYSARVWINTGTGEVIRMVMDAFYSVKEIDSAFIKEAMDHLREAGYKGKFTVTGLKHFAHYGTDDKPGMQTNDGLMGEEGQIDYVNGVYDRSTFELKENEVSAEVKQAGLRAIKLLREQGTDHLYSIKRTVAPKWDILVLTYGESEYGASIVLMDYATLDIIQVADYTLAEEKPSKSVIAGQEGTELMNMDKAKLQQSAAAIADEMFGIRLEDYTVVKEMSAMGTITFKSPDGATLVSGSFNLDGVFYSIEQTSAP